MLTKKQQEVLEYINTFIQTRGMSPTVRELCSLAGVKSTSTIAAHLDQLQAKGYIMKESCSPRTIRVIKEYEV